MLCQTVSFLLLLLFFFFFLFFSCAGQEPNPDVDSPTANVSADKIMDSYHRLCFGSMRPHLALYVIGGPCCTAFASRI